MEHVRAQEIALLASSGYEGKAKLDFEALAENLDGQGMSFGVIQWNFGQGTLGPILKEMRDADTSAFDACFGDNMSLHTADQRTELGQSDRPIQLVYRHTVKKPDRMEVGLQKYRSGRTIQINTTKARRKIS